MKIYRTQAIQFATVDTDLGEFRVGSGGNITVWREDLLDYCDIYDYDYEENELAEIRNAGFKAMGLLP